MHGKNLHNFTLIVATHNRHHYLNRSVAFFAELEADIIYCDSSTNQYTGFMEENMSYLHLPGKKFAEKLLIALDCVKTDYVAMCADDDFILYSALYKGILALEDENTFKTVVGRFIAFHEEFDGNFYYTKKILRNDIDYDASENAKVFFSNYDQILWAMYKKEILIEAFKIIDRARFSNENFFELVIGSIVCYSGGIKCLNQVWGIREMSNSIHWGDRHRSIANIFQDRKIRKDFQKMKLLLDAKTFHGFSDLVLKNYLKACGIKDSRKKIKEIAKGKLKEILPEKIKSYIRRKRSEKSYVNSFEKYPNLLIYNSISEAGELNQIRDIIATY